MTDQLLDELYPLLALCKYAKFEQKVTGLQLDFDHWYKLLIIAIRCHNDDFSNVIDMFNRYIPDGVERSRMYFQASMQTSGALLCEHSFTIPSLLANQVKDSCEDRLLVLASISKLIDKPLTDEMKEWLNTHADESRTLLTQVSSLPVLEAIVLSPIDLLPLASHKATWTQDEIQNAACRLLQDGGKQHPKMLEYLAEQGLIVDNRLGSILARYTLEEVLAILLRATKIDWPEASKDIAHLLKPRNALFTLFQHDLQRGEKNETCRASYLAPLLNIPVEPPWEEVCRGGDLPNCIVCMEQPQSSYFMQCMNSEEWNDHVVCMKCWIPIKKRDKCPICKTDSMSKCKSVK